ncbi:MAG: hypothetical protein M0Z66_12340 [Thermaerobacter sp.]|nr:hypothetical protein [Thermaerobacter sp.]
MKRLLVAALLPLLALVGCGQATSIDTRALVVGIAVDKGQKPGELRFTFQVPSPQSLGGGGAGAGGNNFYYPTAKAPSLAAAISYVENRTSRDIYLGQLHIILVALDVPPQERDRLAQEEQRLGEVDHTEWVAFSKPPAAKMLQPPPSQEQLPSMFYSTHFNCRSCQSTSLGVQAWRVSREYVEPGRTATLPIVRVADGQYDIGTVASFRSGEKPVVFNQTESSYLMLALGQMHKGVIQSQTPLGTTVVRSLGSKAKVDGGVDQHGKLHLSINLNLAGTIAQPPAKAMRITADVSRMIAQATAQTVEGGVASTIRKAQSAGVDPFRFARALYQKDPEALQALGEWHSAFSKADVAIHVKVTVPQEGITV